MTSFLPKWLNRASTFLDSTSGAGRFVFTIAAQSFSGTVAISVLSEQQVLSAPYQINAEAIVTDFGIDAPATNAEYDPQFHDIEYIWSVEKVGNASYATSTYSAVSDLPTHMKVKGTKYGKRICHVIGIGDVVAGETNTFRFTVTAINLATGESATSAPLDKVVAHPDDFFTAAETFVVRMTSATDYPTTTNPIYSSMSDAKDAIELTSLTRARVCVERGQADTGPGRGPTHSSGTAILYDAWGSGGPYANVAAGTNGFAYLREIGDNYASFQVSGFEISGGGERAFFVAGNLGAATKVITVSDCKVGQVGLIAQSSGADPAGWLAYSNFEGINYHNIGMFTAGKKSFSLIGTRMGQSPDANSHNAMSFILAGADPGLAGGGYGLRMGELTTDLIYISQCDFHQRQGWFENAPGYADVQNWLRLYMTDTQRVVIDRVVSETGIGAAGKENAGTHYGNILVDKCLFIGQSDTKYFLGFGAPMTVRNCIFIKPPSKNVINSFNGFINGTPPVDSLHKVYNNSFINLDYAATAGAIHTGSTRVVLANNVNHQPNLDTPISAGTFSLTELFTPRYIGYYTAVDGQTPQYAASIGRIITPFTAGEIVTGQTSGVVKTYRSTRARFQSADMMLFDMDVVYDRLDQVPGFERFNPTVYKRVPYRNRTGAFTQGATFSSANGAFGTIWRIFDDDGSTGELWIADYSGTTNLYDSDTNVGVTITDGAGGSAEASADASGRGERLLGSSGGEVYVADGAAYGNPFDSTHFSIGLIARTKTATHKLSYDGGSGTFTEGGTLTATGKSATICQVYDNGDGTGVLYLRDITGTFADNDAVTDGTATANAAGGQASAGTGAAWVPTSAIALESGTWAEKPFIRKGFTGQDITASQGAGLIGA